MSRNKSWPSIHQYANLSPADETTPLLQRQNLYLAIHNLIKNYWTPEGGSNGLTAGAGSRWSTVADIIYPTFLGGGDTHRSSMTYRSPDGAVSLGVVFDGGSLDQMRWTMNPNAYSGWSTTALPNPGTDQKLDSGSSAQMIRSSGTFVPTKYSGAICTDGSFWFGYGEVGTSKMQTLFVCSKLDNPKPDTCPWYFTKQYVAGGWTDTIWESNGTHGAMLWLDSSLSTPANQTADCKSIVGPTAINSGLGEFSKYILGAGSTDDKDILQTYKVLSNPTATRYEWRGRMLDFVAGSGGAGVPYNSARPKIGGLGEPTVYDYVRFPGTCLYVPLDTKINLA